MSNEALLEVRDYEFTRLRAEERRFQVQSAEQAELQERVETARDQGADDEEVLESLNEAASDHAALIGTFPLFWEQKRFNRTFGRRKARR